MNISELQGILSKALKKDKRRIEWLSEMIQGLYVAKTSNFSKVARVIKSKGKVSSRYRRIQRFFKKFDFKDGDCASIVMNLFDWGNQKPYLLKRIKTIRLKKHGRKMYSLFRVGLDFLCEALLTETKHAIKTAINVLTLKRPPPMRPSQIKALRSFVVY